MLTAKRMGGPKMIGAIVVLVAVAFLFASYNAGSEQDLTLEEQITSCQAQLASLQQLLEEIRQTNLEQWASLQSRIEQMRIDYLSQATAMESRLNQTAEDYLAQIDELESQLEKLRTAGLEIPAEQAVEGPGPKPTPLLKIAYLNAEDAFTVFTDVVKDLRQKAVEKQSEIVSLQQQYLASAISKEEFDTQNNQLQVELLQAQLNIDIGTIDRMIASPGFSDIRSDLQRLREEAQPVIDEMKKLVSTVRVGITDPQEFQNRYNQVKTAFTQLDQLLTQAATAKIAQVAAMVAAENGYDLVLRTKNVIIYRNTEKIVDITDLVRQKLASYL